MPRENRRPLIVFSVTVACFAWGPQSSAHDLDGIVAEQAVLDDKTIARIRQIEHYREILAGRAAANKNLEGVVERGLLWRKDVVSVCFMDGEAAAWEQIAAIAKQWTHGTRLRFDFDNSGAGSFCGSEGPSDIRVSFEGGGYRSYVGTIAKIIPASKPTLILSGMGSGEYLTPSQSGTVLHEFGHALGFHHEHQSPKGGCDAEFNWPYLYSTLGWEKEEVDRNLREISRSSSKGGLFVTDFDSDSIMLYSLDPRAFINPGAAKCLISRKNNTLSNIDVATVIKWYPPVAYRDVSVLAPVERANVIDPDTQKAIAQLQSALDSGAESN